MRRAGPARSVRPLPDDEARRLIAGAALDAPVAPRFSSWRLPVLVGAEAGQALPTTTQPGLEDRSREELTGPVDVLVDNAGRRSRR